MLTGITSAAVVALMGAVLVSTTQTVRRELAKNEAAGEILNGVFNVSNLTQEYVLRHEERALAQWHLRDASLSRLLEAEVTSASPEDETLANLRQANANVQSLFSQIVSNYQTSHFDDQKNGVLQELEERLTGQIAIRIEAMTSDAFSLSELSRMAVLAAQRREGMAVAAFGSFMLLVVAGTMLVAVRSVLRPLARLRAGAAIVGAGDINFRLNEASRDEIGDVAHAFNDMTDKLKTRDAEIRRLVDSNIIGIIISNSDGEVLEANNAFLDLVGYDRADLKSGYIDWKKITPPEFQRADIRAFQELKKSGVCGPFEKEYLRKDGHRVPVMIGVAPLEGSPTRNVAFVLDLTERKLAQEALVRTQTDLARLARVSTLGALTASIAHEVNQPLSGIITNASTCLRMLAADPPNVDGARETARRTIRDGNRASDVITRLRALFGNKDATTEPVDLNLAAREVIELLRSELQKNRVVLQLELAEDLSPVVGDRVQLQQVILNLLVNAVDAMSGVQDRPRQLALRTERDKGNHVRLTVQDTGVGFGPQGAERLFDAFYTTKLGGMGIGLSISRSIIESHRGRLWAAPNSGPGATFSFSIPRQPESSRGA